MRQPYWPAVAAGLSLWLASSAAPVSGVPTVASRDFGKSCEQLDFEISALVPATHTRLPGFFDNPSNAVAGVVGIGVAAEALGYWVFTEAEKYGEQEKIRGAQQRVAELRLAKAWNRCFEE